MINAAVVGLGTWGKTMVESLAGGSDLMRFTTLQTRTVTPDVEAFAKQHSLRIAKTYEDVLTDSSIQAVALATPASGHLQQIEAAARAGKHVYCEKPLAHSVSEVRLMRDTAAKQRVVTQMGTQIHAGENYRRVVEIIQAGTLGAIRTVRVWQSNRVRINGALGQANGPSAATLTDDLSRPIAAYNFTEGARPKCGDTDRDIYRIFMTGLDGTPMPSFADNIKPDEAWDLVFYLRTLMSQPSKAKTMAKQLGLKPVDPNAPAGQQ